MKIPKKFLFSFIVIIAVVIFLFSPRVVFAQVVINEILPTSHQGPDWVELYNSTTQDVNLNGWVFDDEGTQTNMFEIKEATISAQGFLVFEVGSRLNKNGDTIYLINNQGLTVDEYQYTTDPGAGISFGRMPDGGDWGVCNQVTPGGTNQCILPPPTPTPTLTPTPTPTLPPPTPTLTKTPTPTLTITPKISTPTPTQKISPTPTPKKSNQTATASGEVLGEEVSTISAFYPYEATDEAEKNEATPSVRNKILPKFFLIGGLLLLFISASWLWYNFVRN